MTRQSVDTSAEVRAKHAEYLFPAVVNYYAEYCLICKRAALPYQKLARRAQSRQWPATFATMEAAASKIGHAVTQRLLEDLALTQTQLLNEPQPCPTCQILWPVKVQDRTLTTAEGPVELPETVCHCSACRRDFFPSTRSIEASSTRL